MRSYQEFKNRLLEKIIGLAPTEGAGAAGFQNLAFTRPPRPDLGDLALGAFPLSKTLGCTPAEAAQRWAEAVGRAIGDPHGALADLPIALSEAVAAGPYVNLKLDPAGLARLVMEDISRSGSRYGRRLPQGRTTALEYSSPNTNKPLHLGHLRNNLLGMALCNILEASGERVVRVTLVNDRGIHICRSMLSYRNWGGGETPETTGEKGDHFVGRYYVLFNTRLQEERAALAAARGIDLERFSKKRLKEITDKNELRAIELEAKNFEEEFNRSSALIAGTQEMLRAWEAGDPGVLELWRRMNEWVYQGFRETYARIGARFDRWYFESEVWQRGKAEVLRGLEEGIFRRKEDGSIWAPLESAGLEEKVVLRADGTAVYMTQDIGTAIQRFEDYAMDRSIYVVGSEQNLHFQNLFAILKLLGHEWADRCRHASYGMVNLAHGLGRLKSREGVMVDADNLLQELHDVARRKIDEGGYCSDAALAESTAEMIGQGALKLYLLQVSAEKNLTFDPNETISFTGDTGPSIQYSHARIHGILRKGIDAGLISPSDLTVPGLAASDQAASQPTAADGPLANSTAADGPFLNAAAADPALLQEPEEREVIRLLAEFPEAIDLSSRQLSAAPVAAAILDLTKAYARMYHEHEVLRARPELLRARLQLSLCVAQVLRNGLGLLTIQAPERM